jgi:hypothetical protein
MLIAFKILFILFSLFSIYSIWKRRREQFLGIKGAVFWCLFWVAADVVVIWPKLSSFLANKFGIGRGVDFIVYISIAIIFFLLFKLHIKIESVSRNVTELTRKRALDKLEENS